ncbi:hypothetical protein BTVI_03202 [Pitangus sulphuratus]|nr:hypothetical protein BTVI_03202 [Pitangus sulphuratus]
MTSSYGGTQQKKFLRKERSFRFSWELGLPSKSKVKGPAREIQFLGVKWQDGRRQILTEVIDKITAMAPLTSKKETQAFLGAIGFWRMHIPKYSQIVSPLYLVTRKKNDFQWGPKQQQAFEQIKQEIAHTVALGPVRTGPDMKNVLYSAVRDNGPSWSLWQKVPGATRDRSLGFWSRSCRGSEANYTPTEKDILVAYEGVQTVSEAIGTEEQLLLAPRLPVLSWMFKEKMPSTHHTTDATWSKWIALIAQRTCIGNPNHPGILEIITTWTECENFSLADEEEGEQVTLFNPKTLVKMFLVTYDFQDMPANHVTFLRHRIFRVPMGEEERATVSPSNPLGTSPPHKVLCYLMHLRFLSSKSGKIYLHNDIHLLFSCKSIKVYSGIPYELKSFTEMPRNPSYSPRA